jgi:MFS family permease
MNAIAGGNTLGPLICGFIVSNLSWRWHKWIAVMLTALNFVCVVLFVPETRYQRSEKGHEDGVCVAPSQDKVIHADMNSVRRTSDESVLQVPKKTFVQELSLWSGTSRTNLFKMFIRCVARADDYKALLTYYSPFPMIVYPAVIYSFLCYSISLVIVVAVNILNPFVLQAPPYSWSPQINGLINIPGLLGNLFGAWAGGEYTTCGVLYPRRG